MGVVFTPRAQQSLLEIGFYLKEQNVSADFIRHYLKNIKTTIKSLLAMFPESGVIVIINGRECRRIIVKDYSVVYQYKNNQVTVLLLYKENNPHF